jgi:hypothetical protein
MVVDDSKNREVRELSLVTTMVASWINREERKRLFVLTEAEKRSEAELTESSVNGLMHNDMSASLQHVIRKLRKC